MKADDIRSHQCSMIREDVQRCWTAQRRRVGIQLFDRGPRLASARMTMTFSSEKLSGSISVFAAVVDRTDCRTHARRGNHHGHQPPTFDVHRQ
jgi:hypothetical protein